MTGAKPYPNLLGSTVPKLLKNEFVSTLFFFIRLKCSSLLSQNDSDAPLVSLALGKYEALLSFFLGTETALQYVIWFF